MGFELEGPQMQDVDWNRHSIGFGPAVKDPAVQEKLGTIAFSQDEMKVMRHLLNREVGGESILAVYPNIRKFVIALTGMEQWSVARGCP